MKNLLTFMSPNGKLDHNHRKMLEIQIENSLDYWKPEDIILAFNFPYEYMGIKAIEVPSTLINKQYPANPRAVINSKINIVIYLISNKIITETAFFHDFDSFQLAPIDVKLEKDLGLTCYGFYPPWIFKHWGKGEGILGGELKETKWGYPRRINFGNFFFNPSSLDILKALLERMDNEGLYEEDAMTIMLDEGQFEDRVEIMDPGYNLGIRLTRRNVAVAEKNYMAHFPPQNKRWYGKMWYLLSPKLRKMIEDRFEYKYILITGATGFIGSRILKYLWNGAYPVKALEGDIRDIESIREQFRGAEFVIHTAAKLYDATRDEFESINVFGTQNVAKLCREYKCKLIHFSTVEEKGDYGETKQRAQNLIVEYVKKGLRAYTLRLPVVYADEIGKAPYYPMDKLLNDIQEIIRFNDFNVYKVDEKPADLHQPK
jgi:hypothetical protein